VIDYGLWVIRDKGLQKAAAGPVSIFSGVIKTD
jgi:hypothetical protein